MRFNQKSGRTILSALVVAGAGPWGCRCGAPEPPPARITDLPDDLPATARVDIWRSMVDDEVAVRSPADGQGEVTLVEGPSAPLAAGGVGRWHFRFLAGPLGIARGGSLTFQAPPFWGWSPPQAETEQAPGFTRVQTDARGVDLAVDAPGEGMLRMVVTGAALPPGATVDVVYGDGPRGARADRFAERGEAFWFSVDGDGDGVRALLAEPLRTDVVAGPPAGLILTLPSTARPGQTVRLTVAALDAQGNAGGTVEGPVLLALGPGLAGPEQVTLGPAGTAEVALEVSDVGVLTVHAGSTEGMLAASNPMVSHPEAQPILWADLQVHTALSDGTGALDDVYAYARDVAGLDAVAITDHDHWGMRFLDRSPERWAAIVATAQRWDAPGRFVAFPAYEWTSWLYGHRHVLYVGEPGPVFGSLDVATRDPAGLWRALEPFDALTIAHHSAGGPVAVDWRFAPPQRVEPVTEICSVHGVSEAPDAPGRIYDYAAGNSVREAALGRGYRLGFLCSTDGHDGHPGLSQLAGPAGGLAAILTDDVSREGIARALRARHAYGTNGPRIVLRVEANGGMMGDVVPSKDGALQLAVRVVGTARLTRIDVVRGRDVVEQRALEGSVTREEFVLTRLTPDEPVYVRVIQEDGGAAWSSPVWVAPGGGP